MWIIEIQVRLNSSDPLLFAIYHIAIKHHDLPSLLKLKHDCKVLFCSLELI